ncbi:MAG: NAD(+)/NADH kinase [Lachnospiraceae bacterium]|nr:NAD(+)/NADH kinase [Lachnospiraceae bacterium]
MHFVVITKNERALDSDIVKSVSAHIQESGSHVTLIPRPRDTSGERIVVPEDADYIITIGGDGTLVRAAQMTFKSGVPLIGVNLGHLGFLCDVDEDEVNSAIDRIISGEFEIEHRMMLSGYVLRENGEKTRMESALNDIVIVADDNTTVLEFTIYVNGKYLYSIHGDGMIFATPTGSTAYNLAAFGPIVNPTTELILMTPINAHSLGARSIVLDPADEVELTIHARRTTTKESGHVTYDGTYPTEMGVGDKLIIKKSDASTRMIRIDQTGFLERMRRKLSQSM